MKLKALCTVALALLATPASVTAEKEPLVQETLDAIKALHDAVAAYKGGVAGIPTMITAMRNTMGIRKKLNDYVAGVTMYDEKDSAVIRNTTSTTADAMVDLLNMGRVKVCKTKPDPSIFGLCVFKADCPLCAKSIASLGCCSRTKGHRASAYSANVQRRYKLCP